MLELKSCKNCRLWTDIKKTLEVKNTYTYGGAVIRATGTCNIEKSTYGNYTTESYFCKKWTAQK